MYDFDLPVPVNAPISAKRKAVEAFISSLADCVEEDEKSLYIFFKHTTLNDPNEIHFKSENNSYARFHLSKFSLFCLQIFLKNTRFYEDGKGAFRIIFTNEKMKNDYFSHIKNLYRK